MSKFLFLVSGDISSDDDKTVHTLGSVLYFDHVNAAKSATELFAMYDVIILNINKFKDWYGSYRVVIRANPQWKAVFMHPIHTAIDEKVSQRLKNEWSIDSILKVIPNMFVNKADLIDKILAGHLPSVDIPATESCIKQVFIAIGQKLGCLDDSKTK